MPNFFPSELRKKKNPLPEIHPRLRLLGPRESENVRDSEIEKESLRKGQREREREILKVSQTFAVFG